MSNKLSFNNDARAHILKGINTLAAAVTTTLGPKGNCVVITDYTHDGKPHVTKDGVTVAKNITLQDPEENAGACMIREAALKTVTSVGDATTTSIVLANALINAADEHVQAGANPVDIKQQIQVASQKVLEAMPNKAVKVRNAEDLKHIATISANNDEILGTIVADSFNAVGPNGIVRVEEAHSTSNTSFDVKRGIHFENGYLSNHFATANMENPDKSICELTNPYVLLSEKRLEKVEDIAVILNGIAHDKKSLLIVAADFDNTVVEAFRYNAMEGRLKCCLVKAPLYGEFRKAWLEDIAVFTGSQCLTYDNHLEFKDVTWDMIGKAGKVIVSKDDTTILDGYADSEVVKEYVNALQKQLEDVQSSEEQAGSFVQKQLEQRIAQLAGGIATIYVGGITQLEMKERKDRIEDAVCATSSAVKYGIVRGGGVTHRDLALNVFKSAVTDGERILRKAMCTPYCTLLASINKETKLYEAPNTGWNILTGTFVSDVLAEGIIDPYKACEEAFQNAISVVLLYLSTACVISPLPNITIV